MPDWVLWSGLLLIGALVGMALALLLLARLRVWRGDWFRGRGLQAERDARRLLVEEGFAVTATRPKLVSRLRVNGDPISFAATPDFLAEKDGQRYVVEVKRRDEGSGVANAAVRRQTLEYLYASGLPCLLVLMPAGDIELIELVSTRGTP